MTSANGSNDHTVAQPRSGWLQQRKAQNRDGNFSQMHYARQGTITEEMDYVARREKLAQRELITG